MCWPECLHHHGPGCCFFHQAVIHPSPSLCAIVVVRTLSFILTFYYSRPGPVFRACNPSHFSLNALSRGRLLLSRSCIVCRMCNTDVLFQNPHVVFYLLLQLFRIMHPTRQVFGGIVQKRLLVSSSSGFIYYIVFHIPKFLMLQV